MRVFISPSKQSVKTQEERGKRGLYSYFNLARFTVIFKTFEIEFNYCAMRFYKKKNHLFYQSTFGKMYFGAKQGYLCSLNFYLLGLWLADQQKVEDKCEVKEKRFFTIFNIRNPNNMLHHININYSNKALAVFLFFCLFVFILCHCTT